MKKSVFASLSLFAIATVALVGCQPTNSSSSSSSNSDTSTSTGDKYTVHTLDDLLQWDMDTMAPLYEGEAVRIENAGVVLAYENSMYVQQALGQTVDTLLAVEVRGAEGTNFVEDGYFYNNLVNVEGICTTFEGRIVIEDAKVELLSTGEGSQEGNVYYWGGFSRNALDMMGTRFLSGLMFEAELQLATVPGTIEAGKETSFYVTFPGEDLDVENEENPYLIEFKIPSFLSANEVNYLNEVVFKGAKVGDGFVGIGALHFVDYKWEMLYIPGVTPNSYLTVLSNIYNDYASLKDKFLKYYFTALDEIPDLVNVVDGKNQIFSYVGNDSFFTEENSWTIDITAYTYDPTGTFAALRSAFEGKDWVVTTDAYEEQGAIAIQSATNNHSGVLIEQSGSVLIEISTTKPYIEETEHTFATFEEANALINEKVNAFAERKSFDLVQADGFATAVPSIESSLVEGDSIKSVIVDRSSEGYYFENGFPHVIFEVIAIELNTNEANLETTITNYAKVLGESNFSLYSNPSLVDQNGDPSVGLYNTTTGEFLSVSYGKNTETGAYMIIISNSILDNFCHARMEPYKG